MADHVTTTVKRVDLTTSGPYLTEYERLLHTRASDRAITDYAHTLKRLRGEVQSVSSHRDEIEFAVRFKHRLEQVSSRHRLPQGHFSVDVGGEPLLIKEGKGEHLISPTHFESGAYFSHPHADHQLDVDSKGVPSIKIGRYVRFGRNASINAGGDVTIGDGRWLSPGSQLLRQDHDPYGRPSVGSRTVAMTQLPPIVLADYAWVGREAMVGWGADYIGKSGIVATRSFVNSWVGDYSTTGDHGRIIQYQPFKAFAFEHLGYDFHDAISVDQWEDVNNQWIAVYNGSIGSDIARSSSTVELFNRPGATLLIDPSGPVDLLPHKAKKIDAIGDHRRHCAALLQFCIDEGRYGFRFRGDLNHEKLPFPTAGYRHFRKTVGYNTIVCHTPPPKLTQELMREACRVSLPEAIVVVRSAALNRLNIADLQHGPHGGLIETSNIVLNSDDYVILKKVI